MPVIALKLTKAEQAHLHELMREHDCGPRHCDYCLLVAALKLEEMESTHWKHEATRR